MNKTFKNALWSTPFTILSVLGYSQAGYSSTVLWIVGILTFSLCMLKATGHGQYFLARMLKAIEPERFDFLIKPFFGQDWRTKFPEGHKFSPTQKAHYELEVKPKLYLRNVVGMSMVGFLAVSGAVLTFSYLNPVAGAIIALGGLAKGLAYVIGETLLPNNKSTGVEHFKYSTEIGEALTGLFAYGGLSYAYWFVL